MHLVVRTACCCAFVLLAASAAELRAQERRDSTRRAAATSAEELHRVRRAWLEQRRLGRLDASPPVFGSAIVGPPRPGHATGIAVGGPVRGGYGAPFGLPYGAGALHCDALIQSGYGGFGGHGGYGGYGGFGGYGAHGGPAGGAAFAGRCLPVQAPLLPFGFPGIHGFPGRDGLPYPAYPAYGRFYGRFNEDARRRYEWYDPLLYGIQEYDWGWWGPTRTYPGAFGWADGAYGWYSAPPWSRSPADCVDLTVVLGNGRAHRLQLGLQSLGLADTRDLDLAIDARLSQGRPVMLQGLDGRVLRIEPGTAIDDLIVGPCGG